MYKERIKIKTYNNELQIANIETIGKRVGCYTYCFYCANCKNQSIYDDIGYEIHACINRKIFINADNEKVYCKNYCK